MALKTYNPTTPGQRQLVMVDRSALYKGKPVKALTEGKLGNGGRNNTGRITVRFRGGGHKKAYRMVDFKRNKVDVPAVVERLEYDPNRTAFIGAVSKPDRMNISVGKAGRTRWLGWRPHNRGVVMNPIDHPHGGGEGRTSGGRHPVTPWGKPTKGKKTRSNKSTNRFILLSRHKRKK